MKSLQEINEILEELVKNKENVSEKGYSNAIVGIVDVLGFSDFVMKANSIDALNKLKSIIADAIALNKLSIPNSVSYKLLSDTLIVYCDDITSNNIYWVLDALENFRISLIKNGFLCRGAVVIDRHYIRDDFMISKAFIKAYNIEECNAIYPRIIIDKKIVDIISDTINSDKIENTEKVIVRNLVVEDFDGEYILNPFVGVPEFAAYMYNDYKYFSYPEAPETQEFFYDKMQEIRNGLLSCIASAQGSRKVIEKVNYFLEFYNNVVKAVSQRIVKRKDLYISKAEYK